MTDTTARNSFRSGVIALALAASVQLASADEMSTILGAGCEGPYCAPVASSGSTFSLTQQGASNSASAEQQAIAGSYSNSATLFQNGAGNVIGLTQTGGQNVSEVAQTGNNNSLTLKSAGRRIGVCVANGNYLGLNLNQGQNTSIGVTQFGSGNPSASPFTINTFR